MNIIISIICCLVVLNPQHDRELISVLLLGGALIFFLFRDKIRVPQRVEPYSIILYAIIITLSYFSTIGSSMNYRPLLFQLTGVLAFVVIYTTDTNITKGLIFSGTVLGIAYIIMFFFEGFTYFNKIFMHRNVAGMFFAMIIPLCYNKRLWYYIPVPLIALILSGSRGAVGALALVTVVSFIINKNWKLLIISLLITALASTPFTPFGDRLWHANFFNGRDLFLGLGWDKIMESPIFGIGIGNLHFNGSVNNAGSHNLLFSLHSYGGILAVILFLFPIFRLKCLTSPSTLSVFVYIAYSLLSECAANTAPNNIIYFALLAQSLPKKYIYPLRDRFSRNLSKKYIIVIASLFYIYFSIWSVKHYISNLSIIASTRNKPGISIPILSNVILNEPRNFKVHYYLGLLYINTKNYNKAREHLTITEFLCKDFAHTRTYLRELNKGLK